MRGSHERMYEIFHEINVTPPADLADCAAKLRRLADPRHGTSQGEIEGDDVCLRQVLAFIEQCA